MAIVTKRVDEARLALGFHAGDTGGETLSKRRLPQGLVSIYTHWAPLSAQIDPPSLFTLGSYTISPTSPLVSIFWGLSHLKTVSWPFSMSTSLRRMHTLYLATPHHLQSMSQRNCMKSIATRLTCTPPHNLDKWVEAMPPLRIPQA